MTREEHLAWCKERALVYVERGELVNAMASFGSDMGKHPETDWRRGDGLSALGTLFVMEGARCVTHDDVAGMRRLITGFN